MTDDLVRHLRSSRGWPTLGNAAADRIEELEAKLDEAVDMLRVADAALFAVGEVRSSFPRSAIITTLAKLKEENTFHEGNLTHD